jgi:hypothetical protein
VVFRSRFLFAMACCWTFSTFMMRRNQSRRSKIARPASSPRTRPSTFAAVVQIRSAIRHFLCHHPATANGPPVAKGPIVLLSAQKQSER